MHDTSKRFWLFAGMFYYPSGGMRDFKGSFELIEEVFKSEQFTKGRGSYGEGGWNWYHVLDTEIGEILIHGKDSDEEI